MSVLTIPQCRIPLNLSSQGIIPRTHGFQLISSHPLDLVASLKTYVSTWRICHALLCNKSKQRQNPNQTTNLIALVVRLRGQLVQNQIHQVQMRVKGMTDTGSGGGETKGMLWCAIDIRVWCLPFVIFRINLFSHSVKFCIDMNLAYTNFVFSLSSGGRGLISGTMQL